MSSQPKLSQLQIRVSNEEKQKIRKAAARAGLDMTTFVLQRILIRPADEFEKTVRQLQVSSDPSFVLADLNSLLSNLTANELREAVASLPDVQLTPFLANYVAAMVETACAWRDIPLPSWTRRIAPLTEPYFASALLSLRLHLLTHSPPAFRGRNLFIDATLRDHV